MTTGISPSFGLSCLDAIPGEIVILNEAGELIAANAAWRELAGLGDVCGTNYISMCRQEHAAYDKAGDQVADGVQCVLDGKYDTYELEFPRQVETQKRWINMRVRSFIDNGSRFVMVQHSDITDRKIEQQQADAYSRKSKSVSEELQQFARTISHDLKAPLRGINQAAQWLLDDLKESDSASIQKNVDFLRERTKLLNSLIEGALQYSRAGAEGQATAFQSKQLLEEVIESLQLPADVQWELVGDWPELVAHVRDVAQVFAQVLRNAAQHRDDQAIRITISSEHDKQAGWRFKISDTGPGIAEHDPSRVFQIFHTCSDSGGLGVGLSVVKKLVNRYGGNINIESELGVGTTVAFTLPDAIRH